MFLTARLLCTLRLPPALRLFLPGVVPSPPETPQAAPPQPPFLVPELPLQTYLPLLQSPPSTCRAPTQPSKPGPNNPFLRSCLPPCVSPAIPTPKAATIPVSPTGCFLTAVRRVVSAWPSSPPVHVFQQHKQCF